MTYPQGSPNWSPRYPQSYGPPPGYPPAAPPPPPPPPPTAPPPPPPSYQHAYPTQQQYPAPPSYADQYASATGTQPQWGPPPPPKQARFGVVGGGISLIGAVMVALSFVALPWLSSAGIDVSFSDLSDLADVPGAPGLTKAYFGWLGLSLFVVVVAVALAACCPIPGSRAARSAGLTLGITAASLTLMALKGDGSLSKVFENASIGVWAAIVGFVTAGLGAAIGQGRR